MAFCSVHKTKGLPLQSDWIEAKLERVENGWIAYISNEYKSGDVLSDNLNTNRTTEIGTGIEVYAKPKKRKVLIPFSSGICVPYGTVDKFRVEKCIVR